jgi:hypothetical protein
MNSLASEYLGTTIRRLKYYRHLGEQAFSQLEAKDFHTRPSSSSNSIAMIIQHVSGNMLSRWTNFLTEDGEKEWRRRDEEFEPHNYSHAELIEMWNKGWDCFIGTLESLKKEDLLKTIYIRKEPLSAIDAINRQLAHYPYHVGQILYIAKQIKNSDWKSLSIEKGGSKAYEQGDGIKDPAKKFS